MLTYGSVCSGIEAASVAWECLGWQPAWFSQFDPEHDYSRGPDFPSAVLDYHWPEVPNLGDMTKIAAAVSAGTTPAPDIIVGGTPCQDFSVAGARAGLSGSRGQLTISYGELADAVDDRRATEGKEPAIFVWENVPGVLSSKDNAFGAFLGLLAGEDCRLQPPGKRWANAGYVRGPKRAIAWRILDAQYFGVAQRRRRVFVIASARRDINPAKILFESDGMRRDIAPGREAKSNVAPDAVGRIANGSHWDGENYPHPTLNQSHNTGGIGQSNQELFSQRGSGIIAMAHGQGGAEIKTDGTAPTLTCNHEAPITAYCLQHAQIGRKDNAGPQGKGWQEEVGYTLDSRTSADVVAYGFQPRIARNGRGDMGCIAHSLNAQSGDTGKGDAAPCVALAFQERGRKEGRTVEINGDLAYALTAPSGGGRAQERNIVDSRTMAVRRLTPIECERLQGFPDNHTMIPVNARKQITAEEYVYQRHHNPALTAEEAYRLAKDGPRYKALGNSMAVPVMRWIGQRIANALEVEL
jgi:DNA (cytosine-5)-methyltransferase 1